MSTCSLWACGRAESKKSSVCMWCPCVFSRFFLAQPTSMRISRHPGRCVQRINLNKLRSWRSSTQTAHTLGFDPWSEATRLPTSSIAWWRDPPSVRFGASPAFFCWCRQSRADANPCKRAAQMSRTLITMPVIRHPWTRNFRHLGCISCWPYLCHWKLPIFSTSARALWVLVVVPPAPCASLLKHDLQFVTELITGPFRISDLCVHENCLIPKADSLDSWPRRGCSSELRAFYVPYWLVVTFAEDIERRRHVPCQRLNNWPLQNNWSNKLVAGRLWLCSSSYQKKNNEIFVFRKNNAVELTTVVELLSQGLCCSCWHGVVNLSQHNIAI